MKIDLNNLINIINNKNKTLNENNCDSKNYEGKEKNELKKNKFNEKKMEQVSIHIQDYTPIKTIKYISEIINILHKLLSDNKLEFVSYFYFLDLLYKVGTFDFIFNMFNYVMSVYISLLSLYYKKKKENKQNCCSKFTSYIPIHVSRNYTCTNTYFVRYIIRLMLYYADSDVNTIKTYLQITVKSINTFLDFFISLINIGKFNMILFCSKMLHPLTKIHNHFEGQRVDRSKLLVFPLL